MDTRDAGRLGGLKRSERKTAACRENAKLPRKPAVESPTPEPVAQPAAPEPPKQPRAFFLRNPRT
jgi:hypothetical protein